MPKNIYSLKILFSSFFGIILCFFSFSQNDKNFHRFVDSADVHIDTSSKKALAFLDSIPNPLEENIKGRLADYYSIKALVNDDFKEYTQLHQNYILALKYAEEEGNCLVAGEACLELFCNMYFVKKDSTAYKYLDKAKKYYESCDYEYGLIEVEQSYAYAEFMDANHMACNKLILENLKKYKNLDDKYYYLFATYMLTSDYIYLEDIENTNKYFNEFKALKNNDSFTAHNYFSFEAAIYITKADVFFENKEMDSTFFYLKEASKLLDHMGGDVIENYYKIFAEAYNFTGDIKTSKTYIDSLLLFQNKIYRSTVNASVDINESLSKVQLELNEAKEKKFLHRVLIVVLFLLLIFIGYLYFLFYKKTRLNLIEDLSSQKGNLSYFKSNNEKLTIKVQGLEDYIVNLKKEVKTISVINDPSDLRNRIKDFYKNLHLNSSTLLDKSENHIELVNDLNVDFFKKSHELYPQLNNSEVIICYYLYIGFKNKEIAVFLNTTVRAIESKRYRITKKINLENTTLIKHLEATF
ncbi:helix-turn-helix transcriptional regulator [Thalassobellus sediminis]|uniref:helix-turn-helix transcriptional regulator n=1 Tax=Thalassobellus sediminis TaxID=3367753 RepID=UPI0037986A1B